MRVGEPVGPNTPEEPPERCGISYIRGLGLTSTTSKIATDTATDVGDG